MCFKNKRNILIIFSVLLFSLSIIGCANRVTNPPPSGRTTNRTTNPSGTTNPNVTNGVPGSNNTSNITDNKTMPGDNTITGDNSLYTRAERIATAVNRVTGVNNSRVIISNNRALVGVNLNSGIQGQMTDQMKSNIEKAVKTADNQITSVAVTADPDLYTRISNVGTGIRNGRPLSEFGSEVEELFRRVIPR
ncbi:lipoprotein YhcN precursor [Clostridium homopropionicum DSM 5847]|uniref:Lipoprotein YhcN n=1 Tax=Clostridium homopropionicum DSM 5847 TaxID=1121318 RepID=A0A0L6Z7Z3_9CLOT|nr:YhcN/YlaJ family sporulation lipoprotein [Clostridium homopropionicum]KOA19091.1 lipoprotein YhcN precursor [Clostridium homopropionicum DSM 5847]SFG83409.1 sporulation lipoprotein, YhcN/YlaJ family [Clostridium homopropionicum]